jgi:hypothetical protein
LNSDEILPWREDKNVELKALMLHKKFTEFSEKNTGMKLTFENTAEIFYNSTPLRR